MILSTKTKIGIAKLLHRTIRSTRQIVDKPMQGKFLRRNIWWQLDLNEGIDLSIYIMGVFEPATARAYKKRICPGDVVFDVGANMGAHTLPFANLVGPKGQVHAFEPTLEMIKKLRRNCVLNPELESRVIVNHAFCTFSKDAKIPDSIYSSWPLADEATDLHYGHMGKLNDVGTPQLIILDEYAETSKLARVNFIKLDVDGYETAVFKGSQKVLQRDKPVILTEIAPYLFKQENEDIEEFWSMLKSHGYRMRLLNSNQEIPFSSDYFARKLPEYASVNVLLE